MSASDLFSIAGKTALVTGGTRGIGKMIAGGFVDAGATVYISSRKADVCDEVAAELSEAGTCIGIPADLSTEDGCRGLADEMAARVDRLDILVNNAGATWGTPWPIRRGRLRAGAGPQRQGRVPPDQVPGAAAGGGRDPGGAGPGHQHRLHRRHRGARRSRPTRTRPPRRRCTSSPGTWPSAWRPTVTVNAIAPGPFESKMMAATLEAFGEQIAASAPLKRIGRPDDMAGTAIFLSSRAGAYLTGAVIPVDGGIATTR